MKQYTKAEIKEILIAYGEQNEGIIDLRTIDFGDIVIDNSFQKADKIINEGLEAEWIINNYQKAILINNNYQKASTINNGIQKASMILNSSQEAIQIENLGQQEVDKIFFDVGKNKYLIPVDLSKNEVAFGSFRGTYEKLLEESTKKYKKNNPYMEVINYWQENNKKRP